MAYPSVDKLQKTLASNAFSCATGILNKRRDELAVLGAKNWKQIHGP